MGDLAEFLLEQIAKDEADARASAADAMVGWRWKHYPRDAYEEVQSLTLAHSKRVLAECEKNRRIVDAYLDERSRRDIYQRDDAMAVEDEKQRTSRRSSAARTRGLEIALEALALPYADRMGFREEWRPPTTRQET